MTNKKNNKPKKHHYLPQFYLENFKIDNENKISQINVIPKNKRPFYTFVSAIKDTGYNFYLRLFIFVSKFMTTISIKCFIIIKCQYNRHLTFFCH